jgi:hypothetical protein
VLADAALHRGLVADDHAGEVLPGAGRLGEGVEFLDEEHGVREFVVDVGGDAVGRLEPREVAVVLPGVDGVLYPAVGLGNSPFEGTVHASGQVGSQFGKFAPRRECELVGLVGGGGGRDHQGRCN